MRYSIISAALFAAVVSADAGCTTDGHNNWYCQEVNAISYTGVGSAASYNKVTGMNPSNGQCSSTPFGYSGPLSPLNEEVSMHFRGPLKLKQFAYYTPGTGGNSRRSAHQRRHAHGHGHAHEHLHHARVPSPVKEERGLGDAVIATINGVVQSWANDFAGGAAAAPTAAAAGADIVTATINGVVQTWANNYGGAAAAPTAAHANAAAPAYGGAQQGSAPSSAAAAAPAYTAPSSSSSDDGGLTAGGWARQAYYDSASGTSQGLTFLNHHGGSGSGVFDTTFGNSLSYASADGTNGASSPQTLADVTLASDDEIIIMSDQKCGANDADCGYYRDGSVAYHGFGGHNKAFFFEFGMPDDGQTSYNPYKPVNMPAIWLLNAQIPRTLQYGPADCSCWTTGCGEFDIFEVLMPGDNRCKSTLHGNVQGGDSNYFARPTSGIIKAVLIMSDNNIHIKVLNGDDSSFGSSSIAGSLLSNLIADTMAAVAGVSLFALGH